MDSCCVQQHVFAGKRRRLQQNPAYIRENFFVKYLFPPASITTQLILLLLISAGCNKKQTGAAAPVTPPAAVSFENTPLGYPLTTLIGEASGIADSRLNPGYLWVEEDSGNPPQLYLLNHAANKIKKVYLRGAINTDWEDIALAAGPDAAKKYLYIADIGDNDAVRTSVGFYRLEEPAATADTVSNFEFIRFTYADGPRDAEAFLVDDAGKDIFIITKRDALSRIYKLAYPYSSTSINTAVFVASLAYNGVVSAAAGNDGTGLIVKTYTSLNYYPRLPSESIPQTLQKAATALGYQPEPQGEAVGFALDNSGFFTLSEKGGAVSQTLYFYSKK